MPLPTAINPQAVRQVVRYLTGQDTDKGRLALAAYDLEGYALNYMFPGAAYIQDGGSMATATPEHAIPMELENAIEAEFATAPKQGAFDWKAILEKAKTVIGPILLEVLMNILVKDEPA